MEVSEQSLKILIAREENMTLSISRPDRKRFIGQKWHVTDKTVEVLKVKLRVKLFTLHG